MKLETAKSFVLIVLIGVSLLLTLGLWSFQPNGNTLDSETGVETDIGGSEVTKSDVIKPESIIFHENSKYYGFSDPADMKNLYQDMQSWVLYNFDQTEANGAPANNYFVEFIFPDALPMSVVEELFNLNEDLELPAWNFKRMYITFNQNSPSLTIRFLSENEQQQATFNVNNPDKYNLLWDYVTTHEGLREYIALEQPESTIYIPENPTEMTQLSLSISKISTKELVKSLFDNPDLVTTSYIAEPYYYDDKSGMRVENEGKSIVFNYLNRDEYVRLDPLQLLDQSIANINDHKGWTGDFNLTSLNSTANQVKYRMFYNGYPIYNTSDLSIILQEFRNQNLSSYNRPLFKLNNITSDESIPLQSGYGVISYLEDTDFNLDNISDIQIGYRLSFLQDSNFLRLTPAWYMNYDGNWQEIEFSKEPFNKGGS